MNLTHDDVINRSLGMDSAIQVKAPESEEIRVLTEEYLARGGRITVLEPTCKAITDDKWQEHVFGSVPACNRRAKEKASCK